MQCGNVLKPSLKSIVLKTKLHDCAFETHPVRDTLISPAVQAPLSLTLNEGRIRKCKTQ